MGTPRRWAPSLFGAWMCKGGGEAFQTHLQPECAHEGSSQFRSQTHLIGRLYRRVWTLALDVFTGNRHLYICAWGSTVVVGACKQVDVYTETALGVATVNPLKGRYHLH